MVKGLMIKKYKRKSYIRFLHAKFEYVVVTNEEKRNILTFTIEGLMSVCSHMNNGWIK